MKTVMVLAVILLVVYALYPTGVHTTAHRINKKVGPIPHIIEDN